MEDSSCSHLKDSSCTKSLTDVSPSPAVVTRKSLRLVVNSIMSLVPSHSLDVGAGERLFFFIWFHGLITLIILSRGSIGNNLSTSSKVAAEAAYDKFLLCRHNLCFLKTASALFLNVKFKISSLTRPDIQFVFNLTRSAWQRTCTSFKMQNVLHVENSSCYSSSEQLTKPLPSFILLVILKELSGDAHDPLPKGTRLSLCGDESHNGLEILLALEVLAVKASQHPKPGP
ncbi:hypothetical protein BC332_11519 [Capsicum chinense]|nr:hypothetical protein BC332_11519 [Capsicum chinense]